MLLFTKNRCFALICIMLITLPLSSKNNPDKNDIEFQSLMIKVKATPERLKIIPEIIRKKCVHNGLITYLISQTPQNISKKGIDRDHMIGIVLDPKKGLIESNIVEAPYFKNYIWQIASQHVDINMLEAIQSSEAKATVLFDERVTKPNLPLKELYPDIIGIYQLVDGKIVFSPNEQYRLFSSFGFIQLTPFIRKELYK